MDFKRGVDELRDDSDEVNLPYMKETLKPEIITRRVRRNKHTLLALFIGILFAIGVYFAIPYFNFNLQESFILGLTVIAVYAILLFFLLEPGIEKEIRHRTVERYQTPGQEIIKEIGIPIEKPVLIEVEKTRKKLNIPKYNFVGSSKTRTYHKKNCRLCKMIKRKYKVSEFKEKYFKDRGYKACKICLKKKRGK